MPRKHNKQDPAEKLASTVTQAASQVIGSIERLGRWIGSGVSLPGVARHSHPRPDPGAAPGIESFSDLSQVPTPGEVKIQCIDWGKEKAEARDVDDLVSFLATPRPEWCKSRWLQVHGLHPFVVNQLREHFDFHTLAAEDVLRVPQRPKVEVYEDHLFIVLRVLLLRDECLVDEQVSIFLFNHTVITLQHGSSEVWDPIRRRIENPRSRFRQLDTSYLLYALLDAVVDHCFPLLECYGETLDRLEHEVTQNPSPKVQHRIHTVKRELSVARRVIWPTRELVSSLQRAEGTKISKPVAAYMRDVYDHAVQVMDIVETHRELAASLNDLYLSAVSNRMNEVMKVLTIMASFFIPITFVAGVYGMNFDNLPELHWKYSYLVFWVICLGITVSLAVFFHRKGWLGGK